jgi:dTDP-4-amino-4,6-dideoxygalactose transaminase
MDYSAVVRAAGRKIAPWRSILAPNRLETRNRDFLASLARPQALEKLREALRKLTGREHIFFAPSGRAAIARALSLLPHEEVVLPAYTCPVVKTAIKVAGKRIVYVDCEADGLNATSSEFAKEARPGRVLIPTHLFGYSTDIESICVLARDRGCVTLEDAAAALGTRRDGRPLSISGDIGIFSFEKSKRIPAFRGAAIVINNEKVLDPALLAGWTSPGARRTMPAKELGRGILYNAATVPWLYGRFTLPQILRRYQRQEDAFDGDEVGSAKQSASYCRELHSYQASLILRMLSRLDEIRARIAGLVSTYRKTLAGSPIVTFQPPKCDDGGLLRFPVVFPGRDRKDILRLALREGLSLEINYQRPLAEDADLPRFPNAAWAARNVVLLPLYTRLSARDAERIARRVREL